MIRKQVTLPQLQDIISRLHNHQLQTVKDMLEYYMQKIIIRHFQFGNATAYNYPSLDPEYVKRKTKMYGNRPMLVASGVLRDSVTSLYKIYKIKGKFRIILKIPGYGRYVKDIRDYTLINTRDRRDLMRYYHKKFANNRKQYIRRIGIRKR